MTRVGRLTSLAARILDKPLPDQAPRRTKGKGFMRTKNRKTGRGPSVPPMHVLRRVARLDPRLAEHLAAGRPRSEFRP